MFRVVSIVGSRFDGRSGACKAALIVVEKEIAVCILEYIDRIRKLA